MNPVYETRPEETDVVRYKKMHPVYTRIKCKLVCNGHATP